jgi:hypothetical protein
MTLQFTMAALEAVTQLASVSERNEYVSRGDAECADIFFFSASSASPRESLCACGAPGGRVKPSHGGGGYNG